MTPTNTAMKKQVNEETNNRETKDDKMKNDTITKKLKHTQTNRQPKNQPPLHNSRERMHTTKIRL